MIVMPDALPDAEKWYRIQSDFMWFDVLACCRSCATRKLQAYRAQFGERGPLPEWLVRHEGDVPCEVIIPGIGQCELFVKDHLVHTRSSADELGTDKLTHRRGPCTWNGGSVIEIDDPNTWQVGIESASDRREREQHQAWDED